MVPYPKRCPGCGLAETFPGVTITGGICNYCRERLKLLKTGKPAKTFCYTPPLPPGKKDRLRRQMEQYFDRLRQKEGVHGVVALSGGIDSTYVLRLLVQRYRLRVVPVTVDMGYMNGNAMKNIRQTIDKLGIKKHLIIRNRTDLFKKTSDYFFRHIRRLPIAGYNASACMVCHHIIDLILYRTAVELDADFLASGLDRFQTPPELNFLIRNNGFYASYEDNAHFNALTRTWPKAILGSVLSKKDSRFLRSCLVSKTSPLKLISPTWFLDYDKEKAGRELQDDGFLVTAAETNCRFLPAANLLHEMKYGFGINEFVASNKAWEKRNIS